MKILVISSRSSKSNVKEAADVVCYQTIRSFQELGHRVAFAQLNLKHLVQEKELENECDYLGTFVLNSPKMKNNFLSARPIQFLKKNQKFNSIVEDFAPDIIVSVWSEVAQRYMSEYFSEYRLIALSGNLDANIYRANSTAEKHNIRRNLYSLSLREKIIAWLLEKSQLRELQKIDVIFNPALNDVEYLNQSGLKNALYLPMVWSSATTQNYSSDSSDDTLNILLSVGRVDNTSNNLVFQTFKKEIVPVLHLYNKKIVFHVAGGGELRSSEIRDTLLSHDVVIHGFVDDLNVLMNKCDVALILNCYTGFKVSHTRFLHCWEQQLPVVCLPDAKVSMPEIKDKYNTLFGNNGRELINACLDVHMDNALAQTLKVNGKQTLDTYFNFENFKNSLSNVI